MDEQPVEKPVVGIECPKCGCRHLFVTNTIRLLRKIRRYRQCRNCGRRFSTIEKATEEISHVAPMDVKT